MLIYAWFVRPFRERILNWQLIINEFFIFICALLLFGFLSHDWSDIDRIDIGWAYISMVIICVILNLFLLGYYIYLRR